MKLTRRCATSATVLSNCWSEPFCGFWPNTLWNADAKKVLKMRITTPGRTPIWITPRANGGVAIAQGSSHLLLDAREIDQVFDAIDELTREVGK